MISKIKVFTIDDSPIFRQVLKKIIDSHSDLIYSGFAENGLEALDKLKNVDPDIITLDIEMPEMDGIETLRHIMKNNPKPVIMISSFTEHGADVTLEALELGAVDYINKPGSDDIKQNINELEKEVLSKIRLFSEFNFPGNKYFKQELEDDGLPVIGGLPSFEIPRTKKRGIKIICIGASTGGTVALSEILTKIKKDIGIPIVIAQHMPELFTYSFAKRLDSICPLEVKEAKDGERLKPNIVYIAKGGYHMKVLNRRIRLNNTEQSSAYRPSVNILFKSVKNEYGSKVLSIILTGMGSDGSAGIEEINDAGGYTVAQDEESSVIFGMPRNAIKTGKVERIIPLDKIGNFTNEFIHYHNSRNK